MTIDNSTDSLTRVEQIYNDYGSRAKELKEQGTKIVGYLCAYTPLEIITAAGLIPFRIKSCTDKPDSQADNYMENIVCDHVRNCFALSLTGKYNFIDGLVIPHACDNISRTYNIWKHCPGLPYTHFLNLPHNTDRSSIEFFKAVLGSFIKSLEIFTGKPISHDALTESINLYNDNRIKIHELYELRKHNPPLLSGTHVMQTLIAGMSLPVAESTKLINNIISDIKQNKHSASPGKNGARIMIIGTEVADISLIKLVEDSGANIIIDELCPGTRENFPLTDITDDPLDGLAERYLKKINCARTFFEPEKSYQEYLEKRYSTIHQFIRDYHVNGVILYIRKYCDPFGFDVPEIRNYLHSLQIPVLYLEEDYSRSSFSRLSTKIQAFLEITSTYE